MLASQLLNKANRKNFKHFIGYGLQSLKISQCQKLTKYDYHRTTSEKIHIAANSIFVKEPYDYSVRKVVFQLRALKLLRRIL